MLCNTFEWNTMEEPTCHYFMVYHSVMECHRKSSDQHNQIRGKREAYNGKAVWNQRRIPGIQRLSSILIGWLFSMTWYKSLYYIDTSVSLENIPPVKFMRNHIRDSGGVFSILTSEDIDNFIIIPSRNYAIPSRCSAEKDLMALHALLLRILSELSCCKATSMIIQKKCYTLKATEHFFRF